MSVVLHITNRPTPYRLPWFREIGRQLAATGDELHVLFLGRARSERLWRIPDAELHGIHHEVVAEEAAPGPATIEVIDRLSPSSVVLAWAMDLTALRIAQACRARSIPCMIVCGESPWSARANSWRPLRALFRRLFFRSVTGFLSYGESSSQYLTSCGLPRRKIATGLNIVDTDFFRLAVDEWWSSGQQPIDPAGVVIPRDRFVCHMLFVGYLLPVKGAAELLEALATLERCDIALHIVGDGPERDEIQKLAQGLGLAEQVFIHGYVQTPDLPRYYAFADVVVFPSLWEVYGLVMVEAAAAGLPVIASRFAGGTADVVRDGVNGLVVDPGDEADLAGAISILASDPELRLRMGEASRSLVDESLTLAESARRYVAALATFVSYIEAPTNQGPNSRDEAAGEERETEQLGLFGNVNV